jgi:hypothetical protein
VASYKKFLDVPSLDELTPSVSHLYDTALLLEDDTQPPMEPEISMSLRLFEVF